MEEKKYFNPFEGELVKDKIVCRLINEEANRAYLQDKPYTQVEDLAVVYSVLIRETEGERQICHYKFLYGTAGTQSGRTAPAGNFQYGNQAVLCIKKHG